MSHVVKLLMLSSMLFIALTPLALCCGLSMRSARYSASRPAVAVPMDENINQKNSRRLELSIPKNTPHGRWGQGPGNVDPRFPAGLPFPVPEILEFVAFRDSGKYFQQFSRDFPEFSSGRPEQTPETATAFSNFLNKDVSKQLMKLFGHRRKQP